MATVHIYLDKRSLRGSEAQLKIGINKKGSSAYIPIGLWILPSQWDAVRERVKEHPNKIKLNSYIANRKTAITNILMRLTEDGELTKLSATQIKNKIMALLEPRDYEPNSLVKRMELYASTREAKAPKRNTSRR